MQLPTWPSLRYYDWAPNPYGVTHQLSLSCNLAGFSFNAFPKALTDMAIHPSLSGERRYDSKARRFFASEASQRTTLQQLQLFSYSLKDKPFTTSPRQALRADVRRKMYRRERRSTAFRRPCGFDFAPVAIQLGLANRTSLEFLLSSK